MTAPLDEKGLEAAAKAFRKKVPRYWLDVRDADMHVSKSVDAAIRAYLAASPSPSEMEATIRRLRDYRPPSADPDFGREHHPICDEAADLLSSAQLALAAMRAENQDLLAAADADAFAIGNLKAQVLRLTEENEALLGDFATTAFALEAAEARIKALEEALNRIAAIKYGKPETLYAQKAVIDYARDQAARALSSTEGNGK